MIRSGWIAVAAGLLLTPAAFAQNNRSAVASTGLDTNPCTVASPCRSFGTALANTLDGGEVIALDSAGYGPFSVSQSVTVSGAPGVHAAITVPSSGTGVSVSGSAYVLLRNLVIQGGGTANYGIFNNGVEVRATNCVLRGFNASALHSITGTVLIDNSLLLDNYFGVFAVGGHATISRTVIENSGGAGVKVESLSSTNVTIVDSVITNGLADGVFADADLGAGSVVHSITIENCRLTHNSVAVRAVTSGANIARVYLSQTLVSYNFTAVASSGNSTISSFGNNRFTENGSDGPALTAVTQR
jgi:hypothetical protein